MYLQINTFLYKGNLYLFLSPSQYGGRNYTAEREIFLAWEFDEFGS